jgi:glyoxylase-like metal-dependent hydrolase (beta-lactamase superfamily II)
VTSEAKERRVSISWNIDDEDGGVVIDAGTPDTVNMGKQVAEKLSSGIIPIQYKLP